MLNALPTSTTSGGINPLQGQSNLNKVSDEIRTNGFEQVALRSIEDLNEDSGASQTDQGDRGGARSGGTPQQGPLPEPTRFEAGFGAKQNQIVTTNRAVASFLRNSGGSSAPAARAFQGVSANQSVNVVV